MWKFWTKALLLSHLRYILSMNHRMWNVLIILLFGISGKLYSNHSKPISTQRSDISFSYGSTRRRPGRNQQFALSIGRGPYANLCSSAFHPAFVEFWKILIDSTSELHVKSRSSEFISTTLDFSSLYITSSISQWFRKLRIRSFSHENEWAIFLKRSILRKFDILDRRKLIFIKDENMFEVCSV